MCLLLHCLKLCWSLLLCGWIRGGLSGLATLCEPFLHDQTSFFSPFNRVTWTVSVSGIGDVLMIGHGHADCSQSTFATYFSWSLWLSSITTRRLFKRSMVRTCVWIVLIASRSTNIHWVLQRIKVNLLSLRIWIILPRSLEIIYQICALRMTPCILLRWFPHLSQWILLFLFQLM